MMKPTKTLTANFKKQQRELPPLFYYMEVGDWVKAADRIRRHPREAKTWANLRTKSTTEQPSTKRLALHHACFKLRSAGSAPYNEACPNDDPYIVVCRFIIQLIRLYPEAAGQRESRHGCLPLHLAAFASCVPRREEREDTPRECSSPKSQSSIATIASTITHQSHTTKTTASSKPSIIARRVASDATVETNVTAMTAMHAEEIYQGSMSTRDNVVDPRVSVSSAATHQIPAKREELAVQVINALLDAYPKAIRVDSEGGRLVLHTACAGRASPRVLSTLITAYPSACRHRNKDGFLPLHLAAHWGVSHPSVAILLLRSYPDATLGRNRWERTPLEEALCMAGENGRPHQAALVRSLRKHPSFWTRPPSELLQARTSSLSTRPIDMDESIPSNDSTWEAEEEQRRYGHEAFVLELLDENDELDVTESRASSNHTEKALPPAPSSPTSPSRTLLGRLSPSRKQSEEAADLELHTPLATLIHGRRWDKVIARLAANPLEAENELKVVTRGGFTAVRGMTPLHYACERKPPAEVVHCLIEAYPAALGVQAVPGGALPLHIACTWGASDEVVIALLSADSGTARATDELGNVALHAACFSGASVEVVTTLLEVYEKGILARNTQGSRAIDIVRRLRQKNRASMVNLLARRKDDLLGVHHRRDNSSSAWSLCESAADASVSPEFVREGEHALEIGYRTGDALQDDHGGVEITYQEADGSQNDEQNASDGEDLVWI